MPWLTIASTLLKLAASIANIIREQQLMDAGAKAQLARDLADMAKRAGIADRVSDEIDKLTDDQLDEELRK